MPRAASIDFGGKVLLRSAGEVYDAGSGRRLAPGRAILKPGTGTQCLNNSLRFVDPDGLKEMGAASSEPHPGAGGAYSGAPSGGGV